MKKAEKTPSTVYFVGAGPGDPELITIKGMRLLMAADVVVYAGSLVDKKILNCRKKGAKVFDSAKLAIDEITGILSDAAMRGKKVVRLHTGDPCLYSAVNEQMRVLDCRGVPYEVVPGVSSAFAAAASLKKELTVPELAQTVIFTRQGGRTKAPEKERLSSLASHRATICVFLSVSMIDEVVRELKKGGLRSDTPAAVVYRASWKDEVKITGTLKDIAQKAKKAGLKRQALIIVGRALGNSAAPATKLYDRAFAHSYRK
jgi:precorrin-4/cobalt-precorrin-4 C11-methyltransferase